MSCDLSFAEENKIPALDSSQAGDSSSKPEGKDPIIGAIVNDSEGNPLGTITDILGTNQSSIPLAAIKVLEIPIPIVVPVSELMTNGSNLHYWGTKRQFYEIPKRYVLLAAGISSLAAKGPLTSVVSVLATPTVPNGSYMVDQTSGGFASPPPNQAQDNPYSRAGSDIKSVWGGANSVFRKPF